MLLGMSERRIAVDHLGPCGEGSRGRMYDTAWQGGRA